MHLIISIVPVVSGVLAGSINLAEGQPDAGVKAPALAMVSAGLILAGSYNGDNSASL